MYKTFLSKVSLFAGLPWGSLKKLAAMAKERSFRKNEVIYQPQEPESVLFVVQQGKVKLAVGDGHSKEIILYIIGEGEFFGEASLLDGPSMSWTATALEPCRTFVIPREPFRRFVQNNPTVLMKLSSALAARLCRTERKISRLVLADAYEKVASVLLDALEEKELPLKQGAEIPLSLRRRELAGLVGVSRETFTRVIGAFQKAGLVRVNNRSIAVINPARLRREATRSICV
ncbi:MAG: Crp/Fnr family transcriptional regulator [Deltaproteobacteria bacterium]|nr:Crp/Fnr family transcriptional regulator [Deltaproteobacteria bacterium]